VSADERPRAKDVLRHIDEIRAQEENLLPASATEEIQIVRSLV
jgi:hypothetical protein